MAGQVDQNECGIQYVQFTVHSYSMCWIIMKRLFNKLELWKQLILLISTVYESKSIFIVTSNYKKFLFVHGYQHN